MERASDRRGQLVARAMQVRADVDAFNAQWPPLPASDRAPDFTWEEIERQLVDLAPSDLQAELVHVFLERIRAYAAVKPPEMVLREVLKVAALVLDDPPSSD
jgi:hypothetical protein